MLPDGSDLIVADSATAADVAQAIGPRLAKAAVAAKIGSGWSISYGQRQGSHCHRQESGP